jgi:excisionase family DNA binding protein
MDHPGPQQVFRDTNGRLMMFEGMPPLTASDVMTSSEVAHLLRMPQSTVEDLARRYVIPSRKIGRRRLFVRSKVEALLLSEVAP